jgi:hypothetical protein
MVEVSETRFHELIRSILPSIEVDEAWYRKRYRDVDQAVKDGQIKSAKEHYLLVGYFENRIPRLIRVNEEWYLRAYPDAADAVNRGRFDSGQEHFEKYGFNEGRSPYEGWTL